LPASCAVSASFAAVSASVGLGIFTSSTPAPASNAVADQQQQSSTTQPHLLPDTPTQGESMEAALRTCCQGVKIGKILVVRNHGRPTAAAGAANGVHVKGHETYGVNGSSNGVNGISRTGGNEETDVGSLSPVSSASSDGGSTLSSQVCVLSLYVGGVVACALTF